MIYISFIMFIFSCSCSLYTSIDWLFFPQPAQICTDTKFWWWWYVLYAQPRFKHDHHALTQMRPSLLERSQKLVAVWSPVSVERVQRCWCKIIPYQSSIREVVLFWGQNLPIREKNHYENIIDFIYCAATDNHQLMFCAQVLISQLQQRLVWSMSMKLKFAWATWAFHQTLMGSNQSRYMFYVMFDTFSTSYSISTNTNNLQVLKVE